jgi:magnesium-transporting ATPase (P-type)
MKVNRDDTIKMIVIALLGSTPIAFMTFDFMFPNISTPSLEKNMMAVLAISALVGLPCGYLSRRTDMAMMTVILYTAIGYALAVVLYSAPYLTHHIALILPGFYYAMFFRFTLLLLFLYVLGGFVGTVLGQWIRDSIGTEETSLTWKEK